MIEQPTEQELKREYSAFSVMKGRGFFLRFPNGTVLSTQFGSGCQCDNRSENGWAKENTEGSASTTAEIAVYDENDFITDKVLDEGDDVKGYVSLSEWIEILLTVEAYDKLKGKGNGQNKNQSI